MSVPASQKFDVSALLGQHDDLGVLPFVVHFEPSFGPLSVRAGTDHVLNQLCPAWATTA